MGPIGMQGIPGFNGSKGARGETGPMVYTYIRIHISIVIMLDFQRMELVKPQF